MNRKETGLMFKAPLVRAILSGQKTQTRRICKLQAVEDGKFIGGHYLKLKDGTDLAIAAPYVHIACPLGGPGDRIYVRETWQHANFPNSPYQDGTTVFFRADYLDDPHGPDGEKSPEGKYRHWSPAIHMPKAAARIWLEVTGVRVERLHQITDAECWAEGAISEARPDQFSVHSVIATDGKAYLSPRGAFSALWESTGGNWAANPWVWVIDFKRIDKPAAL